MHFIKHLKAAVNYPTAAHWKRWTWEYLSFFSSAVFDLEFRQAGE